MIRPSEALRGAVIAIRQRLSAVTGQSERTGLLATVLIASAISAATAYVLAQCYAVDVLSSLVNFPEDCFADWGMNIGRHCFSDYALVVGAGLRPNPFVPYPMFPPHAPYLEGGPAAAMLPHLVFGLPANWLGVPQLGLIGYLLALTSAVLSAAVWAARGTHGLERVVVFVALGAAAIPAWAVIDRGNSAGFTVPIALVFLVALRRRRWALASLMVVLAALVEPQFAVLAIALFAARQWRLGGLSLAGVVISELAAYLLWPRGFPETIAQSIHNTTSTAGEFSMLIDLRNAAFGRALLLLPDTLKLSQSGGKIPDGFLAGPRSLIGYAVLVLVVVLVLALGRRIPPIMVGIVLLATATLCTPLALFYHLVFVLPVAALIVRDPDGPPNTGIFDQLATPGDRRRAVGICVSLAVALTIAQIPLPGPIGQADIPGQTGTRGIVGTTVLLAPFLWLIACAVIIASYTRRPAHPRGSDQELASEAPSDTAASASSTSEPMAHSSPQGRA